MCINSWKHKCGCTEKFFNKVITYWEIKVYVCVCRIHRNSSVRSRPKLLRRSAAIQHKISPCRRELEPRYKHLVTACRQQRSICLSFYVCMSSVPQLRAALYDIHDIFFEMPLGDRLALLQQDRELRAERKLRDMVTWKYEPLNMHTRQLQVLYFIKMLFFMFHFMPKLEKED